MKFGYTLVPNLLLRAQAKLKIEPAHFNVLMQVMEHWWEADKHPFPSKETIARRMGKSPRQIQRYLAEMEDAGLITRIKRTIGKEKQVSNFYSFDSLVAKLKAVEPEFTKAAELKKRRSKTLDKKTETAPAA